MNDTTSKNKSEWTALHQVKQASLERFQDARFGMFIHWGLYSQLAGVYQGKRMEEGRPPRVAEWIMHAFSIPRKDYQALASSFHPTEFDADAWVALAKSAGMRYMVLTSKHHDGFALFDSAVSPFTSVTAAACKRDFVKELHEACEGQGLAFGLYYSHSIDWMDGGDGGKKDYGQDKEDRFHAFNEWDPGPHTFDHYIEQKSLPQVREILTRYSGLSQIWFDVPYHIPDHHSFAFYKTVSELSPQTLVCERVGNGYGDYGIPGDNVIPEDANAAGPVWETVGTLNNSWGYKSYDQDWKSPAEVLFWIIDIISKGGNYMLNIGPRGDGSVPEESVKILQTVGAWLKKNGEAIYGTRPWKCSKEGPTHLPMKGTSSREDEGFGTGFTGQDFWFTQKAGNLYVISLCPALPDQLRIKSIDPTDVREVQHLGTDTSLGFKPDRDDLVIDTTGIRNHDLAHAFFIRIGDKV